MFQTRIFPRTLRFHQPAGTSRGVYLERNIWYVAVRYDDAGRTAFGLGECAPLFDLSPDFDARYEKRLHQACKELEKNDGALDREALRPYPSILFGLETALQSARASLQGDMFCLYDTPFTQGIEGIRINGLVWMGSKQKMLERMEEKLSSGFSCIKLKIGALDFDAELELIRTLRSRYSPETVELRVDANGAFSPSDALEKLKLLAQFGIHSIEQPIRKGQWAAMRSLCEASPLPIALDEELIGLHSLEEKHRMLCDVRPQFIVLKPSLHGGISGCEEWVQEARKLGIGFWVTSALESNIGLNAIAAWSSTLPEMPARAQGLGTGLLFEQNFEGTGLRIEGERLWRGTQKDALFREQVNLFRRKWNDESTTMLVKTSGSTGRPKEIAVEKTRMETSAETTCSTLHLRKGKDTCLLCLPVEYIAGKMQCVRSSLWNMPLIIATPSSHPLLGLRRSPDFAAMTPMQVYETLHGSKREIRLLRGIRQFIIGGGAISSELADSLKSFPHHVWSTYGMTETLSHIALRKLNGAEAAEAYTPLKGVEVATDDNGCLMLKAEVAGDEWLHTNDLAEILRNGTFRILGRRDNTIVTGGIKLQLERLEERLRKLPIRFSLTAVPDASLGEKLVMVYEANHQEDEALIKAYCREHLSRHEVPRCFIAVAQLPMTPTSKPNRAALKRLAATFMDKKRKPDRQ